MMTTNIFRGHFYFQKKVATLGIIPYTKSYIYKHKLIIIHKGCLHFETKTRIGLLRRT